ncbi:DUF4232 domain-containing protein [Rothia nasimurium]|uniref:DUF4232 domain-containing protein n=1 Tax=Rothia nasimurium TaxID=85336 RepID=UPI001F2BE2ED|nr:DUF4232 domain-containing protein [Rothia nasimurium]
MKIRTPFLPLAALGLLTALTACGSATTGATTAESTLSSPAATTSSVPTAPTSGSATPSDPTPSVTASPAVPTPQPTVQEVMPSSSVPATPEPEPEPTDAIVSAEPTSPAPAPAVTGTQGASSAAGVAVCDYGQIYVEAAVVEGGGAAGSRYITLTFHNTGNANCIMSGYPAVHYVNAGGQQIGAAAANATEWSSSGGVIAPGGSLSATLRETRAQLYGDTCQSVSAAGYSIQAPGSSQPLVMNFAAEACSNPAVAQLSVGAVGATP